MLGKQREKKTENIVMSLLQNHVVPVSLNACSALLLSKRYIIMGKDTVKHDKGDQRYGTSGVQGKIK